MDQQDPPIPKPRPGRLLVGALAITALTIGAILFMRTKREDPVRHLFERTLVEWDVARLRGFPGENAKAAVAREAAALPEVKARVDELFGAWGNHESFHVAVARLNDAVSAAKLAYWVDDPVIDKQQLVMTYDVLARGRWQLEGGRTSEVVHVRRLDHLNMGLAFLGHAGGDRPAVLEDEIELKVMDDLGDAYDEPAGPVSAATWKEYRRIVEAEAGADALAQARRLIQARKDARKLLQVGFSGNKVHIEDPERFVWGDDFLDTLEPYARFTDGRPPILRSADLAALRRADEALRDGPAHEALVKLSRLHGLDTEAHETRHVFEPPPKDDASVSPVIVAVAGDDDIPFAGRAQGELVAYISEMHESAHPCLAVIEIATQGWGPGARTTPHFYASRTLLPQLADPPAKEIARPDVPTLVEALCALPPEALRQRVAAAHQAIVGTPYVPSRRLPDVN